MNTLQGDRIMALSKPPHAPLPAGDAIRQGVAASLQDPSLACVRSTDLFGKDREIMIEHSGMFYRLRLTRANKLILTK